MPDRKKLKIGDKIRLLTVPKGDLEQRKREIESDVENPGWTANTIEKIITQDPVVKIDDIDEFGSPWFTYHLVVDGETEIHSIAITEDESWELI